MNKDLKLIAEAYEDGVWNKAIKWAQGYKPQLDHIHVSRFIQYKDNEIVYKVEEMLVCWWKEVEIAAFEECLEGWKCVVVM